VDEIKAMAAAMHPDAIVYDVSYPFAENWQRLQELRNHSVLRQIPFVVTTSEAGELFRKVGYPGAIELFARPSDLTAFQSAVRGAIETTAPGFAA
jgi:CheY-like chemotaxis protein